MSEVGVFVQTLVILIVGAAMMKDRSLGDLVMVAVLAVMAARFAIARGVPVWTGWKFGDAYDVGVIVFFSLCLILKAK